MYSSKLIMKRIILIVAVFQIAFSVSAQKRELTLSESVLQQNRALRPESINAFAWIPTTNDYTYASANYQSLFKATVNNTQSVEWLKIADVNAVLSASLPNFFGYTWKDAQTLFMTNGQDYYAYNVVSKTGEKLLSLPKEAQNSVFEPSTMNVAFTIDNNLSVAKSDGSIIQITKNTDKNIVSGQSIARNEFGISGGIFWSPNGNALAFYQKDETDVTNYPLVDITETPATLMNIKYPMAGQSSEKPSVGIYSLATGNLVMIQPLHGSDNYLTNLSWTPDEKFVLIAEVNRDQNHYWLNCFDAQTGVFVRTILEETNDKWVEPEHPAFFPNNSSTNFVWISEKDGFNNLYYYTIEGKLIKQLTSNKFVLKNIATAINNGKEIVFSSTGISPLNTLYYLVDLNGKQRCLTIEEGTHSLSFNSNGTYFFDQFSSHSVPNKCELKSKNGNTVTTLLVAKNKLADIQIGSADIGQIKGQDGSTLYTRMIKPSNFDPTKKYPVLVYVYGGPHAQMITNSWLDGANLWMYWMAEQGYIVFTLDNRGSGERGFAFESQIHRQLGTVEMEDQLSGVSYLKSLPYIDSSRLAVHGWSFGGFMTNSLMLRNPGVFNVGVAGGPVTDWKYYEIMYGERYMDRPEQNKQGYEQASLFTHAKNLTGDLLLIHGSVDDVVVPQHNYALNKKFIELGIQVDFFTYPMHKHNVVGKDRVHLIEKVLKYVIENN
jgi:dipeptidyl-peptidase-4